jgi:type IV pilus assembly protein PilM
MQNPFLKLTGLFERAVQKEDSVIGIDVGSAYLKVVQLRRKSGRAVLETYGSLALGPYAGLEIGRATRLPPQKLSEALLDLMREAHVTTNRAGIAIPFESSLVTAIEMFVTSEKELETAVPIEARKYVPVPISEVNLDWWVIPDEPEKFSPPAGSSTEGEPESDALTVSDADGGKPLTQQGAPVGQPRKFQILIAAIHNEAMTRFTDIAKGAGLDVEFFEIEIFSTIRALLPGDNEPHAVVDLGAGETKLYVIDRSLLRLSHIVGNGSQDLTLALSKAMSLTMEDAEKEKRALGISGPADLSLRGLLNILFAEANRAIRSYESRSGRHVKDMILTGGGANLKGIEHEAAKASSVPVVRANPFRQIEAPAFLDDVLSAVGPEFSVAIGAAFRKLQETS